MQVPFHRISKHLAAIAVGAILLGASAVQAAAITWSGATGTAWETGTNWGGNVAPAANDYQDIATFSQNSPANKTPTLAGSRNVGGLNFNLSTGWTVGGTGSMTMILRSVTSTGVGENNVNIKLKTYQTNNPNTWTIGVGNILNANGGIYQDGSSKTLKITGGGTLVVPGAIDGYSSGSLLHIDAGTVKIGSANVYLTSSTAGTAWIDSTTSYLQLKTTVVAAQAKITSGKIQDGTGFGLAVTDLGNNYVQIAAVPEPASMGLLVLGASLALGHRRRRA